MKGVHAKRQKARYQQCQVLKTGGHAPQPSDRAVRRPAQAGEGTPSRPTKGCSLGFPGCGKASLGRGGRQPSCKSRPRVREGDDGVREISCR